MKTGTHFTAKNTCLRLYLAWLDHNRNAKIVGYAQWMGSLLSSSASVGQVLNLVTRLASITSLSASRLPPPPGDRHWLELGRWPKNTRLVICCCELLFFAAPEALFNFEVAEYARRMASSSSHTLSTRKVWLLKVFPHSWPHLSAIRLTTILSELQWPPTESNELSHVLFLL